MNSHLHDRSKRVDFLTVNSAALIASKAVVQGLLPIGRLEGDEWVALNPLRPDRSFGSFKINLKSGCWADFATGDKGGDLVALSAYVAGISQREAAIRLAESIGIEPWA